MKKIFAILLIVSLLFAAVACTDPKDKENESNTVDFEGTTPAEPSVDTDPEEGSQPIQQGGIDVGEVDTNTEFGQIHTMPAQ